MFYILLKIQESYKCNIFCANGKILHLNGFNISRFVDFMLKKELFAPTLHHREPRLRGFESSC